MRKLCLLLCVAFLLTVAALPVAASNEGPMDEFGDTFALGDVNADGALSIQDYMLVRLHLLGAVELEGGEYTRADVHTNGEVNLQDAMLLRLAILGIVTL